MSLARARTRSARSGVERTNHEATAPPHLHLHTSTSTCLFAKALPKTKADPSDIDARLQCQIGSWQAIQTLMMGVNYGGSHAIGHVQGGTATLMATHLCINLPYILEYNQPEIPDKCSIVAECLGAGPGISAADANGCLDSWLWNASHFKWCWLSNGQVWVGLWIKHERSVDTL